MKKVLLLALVILGGGGQVFAEGEIYLRNNISTDWNTDDANFKSEKTWDSTNSQDVYVFTINAETLGTNDFYFRINRYDSDGKLIGPYNHSDYFFKFENGQNETYTAPRISQFQDNSNGAFCIEHSKIKASQYKITIYLKYSDKAIVDNTEYNNIWVYYIKAEIVSMPLTVTTAGYATFSCDRALDFTSAGVTAYVASAPGTNTVSMVPVSGAVPAYTGLFIKGGVGNEDNDITYDIPVVPATSASEWNQTNYLHATYDDEDDDVVDVPAGNYVFAIQDNEIGFYPLGEATSIAKGKAYLNTSPSEGTPGSGPGARLSIIFDDANAISSVKSGIVDNNYYDIQGRRVAQPTKGLYIVNGKKVIKI